VPFFVNQSLDLIGQMGRPYRLQRNGGVGRAIALSEYE